MKKRFIVFLAVMTIVFGAGFVGSSVGTNELPTVYHELPTVY
ncbi:MULTISPECIES: hypothetical protein [Bacillus]|nr:MULTISPECIES: hypothetical protein [Bacillus]